MLNLASFFQVGYRSYGVDAECMLIANIQLGLKRARINSSLFVYIYNAWLRGKKVTCAVGIYLFPAENIQPENSSNLIIISDNIWLPSTYPHICIMQYLLYIEQKCNSCNSYPIIVN